MQFGIEGAYTVALKVTNSNGSSSIAKLEHINVYSTFSQEGCHDLTSSDFRFGFEDNEDFNDWDIINLNTDFDDYGVVSWNVWNIATITSAPFNFNLTANTGSYCAVYRYNITQTIPANDYLASPCMTFDANNTYELTFDYGCNSASYPERLKVVLLDHQNQVVETITDLGTIINTSWTNSSTQFSPAVTGQYRVAFHIYSLANKDALYLDDINISDLTTSGVSEVNLVSKIYPNPATVEVSISLASPNSYTIEILDLSGKLVMTQAFNGSHITLPVAELQTGSYVLRITSNEGTQTESIIIR